MKPLLLIIALMLTVTVGGQVNGSLYKGLCLTDTIAIESPRYDTIPVVLLVCDTAKQHGWQAIQDYVFWQRGYQVRQIKYYLGGPEPDEYGVTYAILMRKTKHIPVAYLDSEKRPIKLLVWMAREAIK